MSVSSRRLSDTLASSRQAPNEQDAYLHALDSVPFDHWAYIHKPDPRFHQQMMPYLLMQFYYVGFQNMIQNWLTWQLKREGPFFALNEEERKQLVMEVIEELRHVAWMVNVNLMWRSSRTICLKNWPSRSWGD